MGKLNFKMIVNKALKNNSSSSFWFIQRKKYQYIETMIVT